LNSAAKYPEIKPMDRFIKFSVCGLFFSGISLSGFAQVIDLQLSDRGIREDNFVQYLSQGTLLPEEALFNRSTGLGTIQMTFTEAGAHEAFLFVDHDIYDLDNAESDYNDEIGLVSGAAVPSGLSWEMTFPFDDIRSRFEEGTLQNSNSSTEPDDVSMALGWDFSLTASQTAIVKFTLGTTQPSGFYLQQQDPLTGFNVYFSSELTVVPELGSTGGVLGAAALATGILLRRKNRVQSTI
jgi:hypothetical protein